MLLSALYGVVVADGLYLSLGGPLAEHVQWEHFVLPRLATSAFVLLCYLVLL